MTSANDTDLVYANGIDANGRYLVPPLRPDVIATLAQGEVLDPDTATMPRLKHEAAGQRFFGVLGDETKLDESGWGVLFAEADAARVPAMKDALAPLLALRKEEAGEKYFDLTGVHAYRAGETKDAYTRRHSLGPGPVDPKKLPYFVLIVGDPRTIPFRFQYLLDVQFAVGRLHFDGSEQDVLDRLERYAQAVVHAERELERGALHSAPHAAFFGARHDLDPATALSSDGLAAALADELKADTPSWTVSKHIADAATKKALLPFFGGAKSPALLFTAGHGLGLAADDKDLLDKQGALVCSDWGGPGEEVTDDHIVTATDIAATASLQGLIAFHFACFSAGTPHRDDFSAQAEQPAIAPHDFVARLPQAMLAHPGGPALAVIGHIDRAWGYSFNWGKAGEQRAVFRRALGRLMAGWPVGAALEDFNQRYAEISTLLSTELEDVRFGKTVDEKLLAQYWTANSDARNYILLGDPAVRLARRA